MRRALIDDIEKLVEKLTHEEQLRLIETLARKLRYERLGRKLPQERDLEEMAADPQIQAELRQEAT